MARVKQQNPEFRLSPVNINTFLQRRFREKFWPEFEGVIQHGNLSMLSTHTGNGHWFYTCGICKEVIGFCDTDLVEISGELDVAEALIRVLIKHCEEKHARREMKNGHPSRTKRIRKIRE